MKLNKNVNLKQFMFGDFDKDGTKNLDDPQPLNHSINKFPAHNTNYYHKARFGNNEVLLTQELKQWQKYSNRGTPLLKRFLRQHQGDGVRVEGRIKTVPSLMKKVRTRILERTNPIEDIAGARILTNNINEAKRYWLNTRNHNPIVKNSTNNYYAKPNGAYRSFHTTIQGSKGVHLETQFKTVDRAAMNERMHPFYKQKTIPRYFFKQDLKLLRQGK